MRSWLWQALLITFGLTASPLQAQLLRHREHGSCCPPACAQPCPAAPVTPLPKTETPPPEQPPMIEPSFAAEQSAAGGDYYAAAPNMIGDLAGTPGNIHFHYLNASNPMNVDLSRLGNLVNAKIAENNSPLPMDRVSFRYNFFHNAVSMTGPADFTQTLPPTPPPQPSPPPGQLPPVGNFFAGTATRSYDLNAFTFSVEKTFFQDLCSVELRVPFSSTLSNDLNLSPGTLVPDDPFPVFVPNTANAFGDTDTEFGDLQLILKGLLYYTSRVAVSTGLGIGAPTGGDNHVRVVDFIGDQTPGGGFSIGSRTRDIDVDNEQWTLSPYLAALVRPTDRLFAQAFYQIYFPVGDTEVAFSEDVSFFPTGQRFQNHGAGSIDGQTLMMADLGIGYWLTRNPDATLTGFAPILELHYTTALEDAEILTLPGDGLPGPAQRAQPAPQVGNFNNRFDFLNLTVGSTAEINQRLLLTTGVVVPLRDGDDRFFDWEFQFQLNYRFGSAPQYLPPL